MYNTAVHVHEVCLVRVERLLEHVEVHFFILLCYVSAATIASHFCHSRRLYPAKWRRRNILMRSAKCLGPHDAVKRIENNRIGFEEGDYDERSVRKKRIPLAMESTANNGY